MVCPWHLVTLARAGIDNVVARVDNVWTNGQEICLTSWTNGQEIWLVRIRLAQVGDGRVTGWRAGERARGPGRRPDNVTLGSRPEPRVTLAPLVGVIVTFARAAAPSVTFPESREPRAESRAGSRGREPGRRRAGAGAGAGITSKTPLRPASIRG